MSQHNPELPPPTIPPTNDAILPQADDFIEHQNPVPAEPERELLPVWLYLVCGFFLFMAGSSFTGFQYLGLLDQGAGAVQANDDKGPQIEKPDDPLTIGKSFYGLKCASCHGANGMGQPGQYPPLVKAEYVTGSKDRLLALMLGGIAGPLEVNGGQYGANQMPGWSSETDAKLAAVTTYIRATWGNAAEKIDKTEFAAARDKFKRTEPWTEAELKKIAQ